MGDGAKFLGRREEALQNREAGLGVCLPPFGGAGVPLEGC